MKQITSKLLISAISIAFLAGCSKNNDKTHKIEGIVLHSTSKKPIANETLLISVTENQRIGPANIEFPNGQYSSVIKEYTVVSDVNGHYSISITNSDDLLFPIIKLSNSKYTVLYTKSVGHSVFQDSTIIYFPPGPNIFDTVFVELPAYVKYTIKNTLPGFDDDTLFVSTPYQRKTINYGFVSHDTSFYIHRLPEISAYNWIFIGKAIDTTITDTIPGESNFRQEITFFLKRTDTSLRKKEWLNISPNTITNYNILY